MRREALPFPGGVDHIDVFWHSPIACGRNGIESP